MNIQEVKFQFVRNLTSRNSTKYIVVHHTASTSDLTVHDIHRIHLNEDYAGIGYHYYIDKSGNIFTGRPAWAVGSHALPINSISIAVCVSGNFEIEKPNTLQLKSSNMYAQGKGVDYSRLFDRFYRVDTSHSSRTQGFGIGLSMAQELTERYKGRIAATWKDGVISFTLTLP